MRKLLIAVAVLLVVGVAFIVSVQQRFDPEALGALVIARVNETAGIRLQAERFSLHPLRGLELEEARAEGALPSGDASASIELLLLRHRLAPLLRRELVIDRVLLRRPVIELVSDSGEPSRRRRGRGRQGPKHAPDRPTTAAAAETSPAPESAALRLSISSLQLEDGELSLLTRDSDEAGFVVEELGLDLRELTFDPEGPSSVEALAASGSVRSGRIDFGDLEILESNGALRLDEGIATLTDLMVRTANADLVLGELKVFLNREPPTYEVSAVGGLDLNGVLGAEDRGGFGPVRVTLDGAGEGPETDQLEGSGVLTLDAGEVPRLQSIAQIEAILGRPLLTGAAYQPTTIAYRLNENRVWLEPFELEGRSLSLEGSGELDLAGPLDLRLRVRLPRAGLEVGVLSEQQLDAVADDSGRVTLPFTIRGTLDRPEVDLDWDAVGEVAEERARDWAAEALEDAKEKAIEWLRDQLGEEDSG